MDRLSDVAAWSRAIGAGPERASCLDALRAFVQGVSGDFSGLAGVERAFAVEGVGFAARVSGQTPTLGLEPPWALFLGVGAGIALAVGVAEAPLSPEEREGLGFGLGLLRRNVANKRIPDAAFAHGLGRSIWFGWAGDLGRIRPTLRAFPEEYRAEIAHGVGFAAAFASGVDPRRPSFVGFARAAPGAADGHAAGATFRALIEGSVP